MKVCTDSCLFGAWISVNENDNYILDIGTGTGLLSLMLAQKSEKVMGIDAIEIEQHAFRQAEENCNASIYKDKINIINCDIFKYKFLKLYDVIVCNPPFFNSSNNKENSKDYLARHDQEFSLNQLLDKAYLLASTSGVFYILLPFYRKEEFEQICQLTKWKISEVVMVYNFINKPPFRVMYKLSKTATIINKSNIVIYSTINQYTTEFSLLLQPYYLYL